MYDVVLANAVTPTSMTDIMTSVGQLATTAWEQVTKVLQTVTTNPYLLIGVSMLVIGFAVSLVGKIIRKA